ncbi:MAG: hypothetical protein JST00_30795 [Deltaproteobacteria bacterium]|nr:hypothetical protein [Deltaproteobacteria bacterium]
MITDPLTAKVLGLLVVVMAIIIDCCFFMFTKPELRAMPGFAAIVLVPSIPLFVIGGLLLRKGLNMKDDE